MIDARPEDTILFYFVGHGDVDDSSSFTTDTKHCIIPSDGESWDSTVKPNPCPEKNISEEELKQWLSGAPDYAKLLVIIDSCYSGGMDEVSTVGELITSAEATQFAWEDGSLEPGVMHAAFTYRLILALPVKAKTDTHYDWGNNDGYVSGYEAYKAVEFELTVNPDQNPQRPNPPYTVDFVIAGPN